MIHSPTAPPLLYMLKKLALFVFLLIMALTAVLLIRTGQLPDPSNPFANPTDTLALPELDPQAAIERLREVIAEPTVSEPNFAPDQGMSLTTFEALQQTLKAQFPRIHQQLDITLINQYALLMRWDGRDTSLPGLLLMAHQDVVPADDISEWQHPPFAAVIEDGLLYGRGTLDDKASMMAQLEAVESLLESGDQPQRTLYLAYGFDEEIGGRFGALAIAEHLAADGVRLEMVLDEGGAITTGKVPGLTAPAAMVGIAEKGYLSVDLTVTRPPGHSSTPPPQTSIEILAEAITRIKADPMPSRLNVASRLMLEQTAPHLPFASRVIMANLWLFRPLVMQQMAQQPTSAALLHSTIATTMISAGDTENVLPAEARAVINLRLLPGDSIQATLAHLTQAVDDSRVELNIRGTPRDASRISPIDASAYERLRDVIRASRPESDLVVLPYLMLGGSDARHYSELSDHIYRFAPYRLSDEALDSIHGHNEHIDLEEYPRMIAFYQRLIMSF